MAGYIILGVTLATFVAIGIWALTEGRRIRWPDGRTTVGTWKGLRVRFVVHENVRGARPGLLRGVAGSVR